MKSADQERFDHFSKDLALLKLRHPVAQITSKTKFTKGYVSKSLNGDQPLSDNFLETFYKHFDSPTGWGNHWATGEDQQSNDEESPAYGVGDKKIISKLFAILDRIENKVGSTDTTLVDVREHVLLTESLSHTLIHHSAHMEALHFDGDYEKISEELNRVTQDTYKKLRRPPAGEKKNNAA